MGLGQANRPDRISRYSANRREALRLDAATGDIMLADADCAEEFDLAEDEIEPGTVMVFSADGPLGAARIHRRSWMALRRESSQRGSAEHP